MHPSHSQSYEPMYPLHILKLHPKRYQYPDLIRPVRNIHYLTWEVIQIKWTSFKGCHRTKTWPLSYVHLATSMHDLKNGDFKQLQFFLFIKSSFKKKEKNVYRAEFLLRNQFSIPKIGSEAKMKKVVENLPNLPNLVFYLLWKLRK